MIGYLIELINSEIFPYNSQSRSQQKFDPKVFYLKEILSKELCSCWNLYLVKTKSKKINKNTSVFTSCLKWRGEKIS